MEELHRKMVEHGFGKKDFEGDQFVRLRTLKGRFGLLGKPGTPEAPGMHSGPAGEPGRIRAIP